MNINTAKYSGSFGTYEQMINNPLPKTEIAFSGRSNVGKSSLLNKLLNRKSLARISATPGKTITVNYFELDDCFFVDLPGYGYAKRSASEQKRWSELVEGYFTTRRDISLVVQLIDIRHAPSADDVTMLNFLESSGYDYIIVLTKSDKLNKSETKKQLEMFDMKFNNLKNCKKIISFSALNGDNCDLIRDEILSALVK